MELATRSEDTGVTSLHSEFKKAWQLYHKIEEGTLAEGENVNRLIVQAIVAFQRCDQLIKDKEHLFSKNETLEDFGTHILK